MSSVCGVLPRNARAIKQRCAESWTVDGEVPSVCADPSTGAKSGISNKFEQPASVQTEYAEHGIHLWGANNDRAAGYLRLLELLRPDPTRVFPDWHRRSGERGSPRLFIAAECQHLIEQFKSAPVAEDGVGAGECVDPKWESSFGHAHASARYFAMTRPNPSPAPSPELDPRIRAMLAEEARRDSYTPAARWTWSP